jgi:hypothetical protein
MPWKPEVKGERPTLGPSVVSWMETWLASPDGSERIALTREQVEFLLDFYEINPETGKRRYRRAVLSRAKGWGRSPFVAGIALAEAFAPVVPDGWDAAGRPVGKPWATIRPVWVQLLAISENQTQNAFLPLLDMVKDGPLVNEPGVVANATFISLPRGRIEYVTASAVSREGNRPVFALLDQVESWAAQNGGERLAAAVRRNLGKTNGTEISTPNAYRPGQESVAEASFEYARQIAAGKTRDDGLCFNHRQAPDLADLVDEGAVREALRIAYGDSSDDPRGCVLHKPACPPPPWAAPLDRILRERLDLSVKPDDWRQFFLNQPVSSDQAVVTPEMLQKIQKPRRPFNATA